MWSVNEMKVYLLVTQDKYQLPLCVEDSIPALARKIGADQSNIYSAIGHRAKRPGKKEGQKGHWPKYISVEIDDEKEGAENV